MTLTAYERETVIRLGDDTDQASVWTCQPKVSRRLQKRGVKPTNIQRQDGKEIGWQFFIPAGWVKLSAPRRVNMTDMERKARALRMSTVARVMHSKRQKLNVAISQEKKTR